MRLGILTPAASDLTNQSTDKVREISVFKRLGALSIVTAAFAVAIPLAAAPANAAPMRPDSGVSMTRVLECC